MTIMSRLLGSPRALGAENPRVPLTSSTLLELIGGGAAAHSGATVTETTALGVPAVWRAVNLISSTAAALPLHSYTPSGAGRRRLSEGPAADLIADPHPDLTRFELMELAYGSICTYGNAYFRKLRDRLGVIRELWWIAPQRVRVHRDTEASSIGRKLYVIDGDVENPLTDHEILHVPGFGYDGVCGVSPIRAARHGVGLAISAEEFGAKLFGTGSLATGILQTDQRLTDEQATALKVRWKAKLGSGMSSAHDVAILDRGAKFHQLTIPPEDAQFIETRRFQLGEIARMYGIPPHMLGDVERSTSWGTGLEQQNIAWVRYGLQAYLIRFEQRLTKMFAQPSKLYVKYAMEGLLRGDSQARAAFYRQLWEIGVLSTNEIRELEDWDAVAGGDTRYVPLNFGILGQAPSPPELPASVPADPPTETEEVPSNART